MDQSSTLNFTVPLIIFPHDWLLHAFDAGYHGAPLDRLPKLLLHFCKLKGVRCYSNAYILHVRWHWNPKSPCISPPFSLSRQWHLGPTTETGLTMPLVSSVQRRQLEIARHLQYPTAEKHFIKVPLFTWNAQDLNNAFNIQVVTQRTRNKPT